MTLFARFAAWFALLRAWFVSSVLAPELPAREPSAVDVVLDEDDLFESPRMSGVRFKVSGVPTMGFAPSEELLERSRDDEREEEITRRVDVRELREELEAAAAAGGRRR